jgi:hypothetical protein
MFHRSPAFKTQPSKFASQVNGREKGRKAAMSAKEQEGGPSVNFACRGVEGMERHGGRLTPQEE